MSTATPHVFLAISLPPQVRQALHEQSRHIRGKLPYRTWPHPEDYHITLVFLGSADFGQIAELKQTVAPAVKRCSPFNIALNGIGTFGKKQQPRVLWAGVSAGRQLYDLQREVVRACRSAGFHPDERPYKPHITLAKKWTGQSTLDRTILTRRPANVSWSVRDIVLYRIHPGKQPKYEPLKIFPLYDDK